MSRLPQVAAAAFVIAVGSCPIQKCSDDCSNTVLEHNFVGIAPGGLVTFTADCTTCGHSSVTLTWTPPATPATGSVGVTMVGMCGPEIGSPTGATAAPAAGRLDYEAPGVRNL
jgi:hypothetical protein